MYGRRTRTFTGDSGSYTGDQSDPVNDFRYAYDALGRLAEVEVIERNDVVLQQSEETGYLYDLLGNLDRVDYGSSRILVAR